GGDGGGVDLSEACHPDIADWPEAWARYEEQVVELTNQARAEGQDCGSYGVYPPAGPVSMDPAIQCAARYHSLWMAENNVFDHYSTGGDLGDDPWTRMANAGFTGSPTGENIAAGYRSPAEVVQGWIDSDGHCANLMNADATLIGVGYAEGGSYGTYWTQDYGR
ncbi:MAG: CAP domain-containing protein, partial [Deltaproteobacteria bacterium]